MDEWMDGYMNGRMDGGMDGQVDGCMHTWMDGWLDVRADCWPEPRSDIERQIRKASEGHGARERLPVVSQLLDGEFRKAGGPLWGLPGDVPELWEAVG